MNIIIGQYVAMNSIIHRLDPRSKLMTIFLFVMIVFLANNYQAYFILGLFTAGSLWLAKIPIKFVWKGMKPVLWVVLFTLLMHLFMTTEGVLLVQIGPFAIYEEGVKQGIFLSLRMLFLILVTTLLTLTTTPIEITDGVETLLSPFKRFGLPAHELALMMSISLRFIPTLMQETEKIMKAQTARGVDFAGGPLRTRFQAIIALLIPLFVSAFKRAEDLAVAMEARGYKGGTGRTKLRELRWGAMDTVVMMIIFMLGSLLALIRTQG